MRILIAEDDAPLQLMAGRLMKHWGFEFDMASNGREAVDQAGANQGKYDLCLMDIDMPIMNGLEAAKIIRRRLKYFPIMALTGNLRAEEEYLAAGMDDFLEKPYSINRLYQKISELTVKFYNVTINNKDIFIKEEMPMDQQHAQELRELAKKNLRKVKFFDGPGNFLIIHKNVTNKISHDFNVKRQLMTTFINRDSDKPTRCELYKESNYLMPQIYLTEEESDNLIQLEDAELEKYPEPAFKRIQDE
ncbi:MAG: response regulator [Desulfosalsimonadaceae bacterium]